MNSVFTQKHRHYTTPSPITLVIHYYVRDLFLSYITLSPPRNQSKCSLVLLYSQVPSVAFTHQKPTHGNKRPSRENTILISNATFERPDSLNWESRLMTYYLALSMGPTVSVSLHKVPHHSHLFTIRQSALIQKTVLNQFFLIIILITATVYWTFIMQQAIQTLCHFNLTITQWSRQCSHL